MSSLAEIDWSLIWRESRKHRSRKSKGRKEWDRKAASFARRNMRSDYIDHLVRIINPKPEETVLDVGSGPGTLAVPLASMANKVTAVDFSAEMLKELRSEADRQGVTNITSIQASWEDDWQKLGVPPHDIAVASRSLSVDDLPAALAKLNEWAVKKVVITDRVGSGPFDPDVFEAVGRPFEAGPDYIITVNMLYQMGIQARIDYIPAGYSGVYPTREAAADSCLWMLEDLQPDEQEAFDRFMDDRLAEQPDGTWQFLRRHAPKWAVISWDK
jgi:SAM-dependent methyltransferase